MLPDRSKRYAGNNGEIPRLGLASNWQLLLIGVLILALLTLIFPHKALVSRLYEQETLDELTLSYIQNLYRAESRNADVAILLARAQQAVLSIDTLEAMLLPSAHSGDQRQRTASRILLVNAYKRALTANPGAAERGQLTAGLADLMERAAQDDVPEHLARVFSGVAFEFNMPRLGLVFLQRVEPERTASALEHYAHEALGKGDYAASAEYFLLARDHTSDLNEARRLFRAGIDALMAASQFKRAMRLAEQHLGNLADDTATLRYLARAALAAGEPAKAAHYAQRLVFRLPPSAESAP